LRCPQNHSSPGPLHSFQTDNPIFSDTGFSPATPRHSGFAKTLTRGRLLTRRTRIWEDYLGTQAAHHLLRHTRATTSPKARILPPNTLLLATKAHHSLLKPPRGTSLQRGHTISVGPTRKSTNALCGRQTERLFPTTRGISGFLLHSRSDNLSNARFTTARLKYRTTNTPTDQPSSTDRKTHTSSDQRDAPLQHSLSQDTPRRALLPARDSESIAPQTRTDYPP